METGSFSTLVPIWDTDSNLKRIATVLKRTIEKCGCKKSICNPREEYANVFEEDLSARHCVHVLDAITGIQWTLSISNSQGTEELVRDRESSR